MNDQDHPADRYPPGTLVRPMSGMQFVDLGNRLGMNARPDDALLILEYVREYSSGRNEDRFKWNVKGIMAERLVVTRQRFTGGEMMRQFTVVSHIGNAEDEP